MLHRSSLAPVTDSFRVTIQVKVEIKSRLDDCKKRMGGLGPERGSSAAQTAYLTDIATQFRRLALFALAANHGADDAFDTHHALRLSPAVMSRMKTFSTEVAIHGHTFSFLPSNAGDAKTIVLSDDESSESSDSTEVFFVRKESEIEELMDILHPPTSCPLAESTGMKEWLVKVFEGNRGFEMGTFNASILATVMKKQSHKWEDISIGFVSDVIVMVHRFITTTLASICTDEEVCRSLLSTIFDDLVALYQKAINNTLFLLKVENNDTPLTLNHYFNDNLQKR